MKTALRAAGENPFAALAVALAVVWVLLALAVPVLPLPDPAQTNLSMRLLPPGSPDHLLGSDLLGRDVLARLLWGTRLSLAVALAATLVAGTIGSLLGLLAGTARGWLDGVIMRLTDVVMAFPYLLLALAIVAVLGPGPGNALIAMAVVNIPFFARSVRGAVLPVAGSDFVSAARMAGRTPAGVVFREVLPNVLPVIVVTATTTLGWMLLETAGLSFLGLGVQPPSADLGSMLAESRKLMLVQPWQAALPGIVVFVLVLGANLGGDLLRDVLDPRSGAGASAPGRATTVEAKPTATPRSENPLTIENLDVMLRTRDGNTAEILSGVSLHIHVGESLGLVGESGSGKSATALAAMRLLPTPPLTLTRGHIQVSGGDVTAATPSELGQWRGSRAGYIFQDPLSALDPMMPVGDQIAEVLRAHASRHAGRKAARARAADLLESLGIEAARAAAFPHEFSGGMRQRVAIAMALANEPPLLVADEPTTALDPGVQQQVLDLLGEAAGSRGAALLFISHDLDLVARTCGRIAVMYAGQIVEEAPSGDILSNPLHPYTRALLTCRPGRGTMQPIPGRPPQPGEYPNGCRFAPRCPLADDACREKPVDLTRSATRSVRCIHTRHELPAP
jgi:peptide/nickel transport system permease protein